MFELNLASLPNHILYLEGVQLSYIKVFVHVFNLWHSQKPCYISNDEFIKRTNLARSTVQEALAFFEKKGVFKKVQKGRKRYLVQATVYLETEPENVDNSDENVSKIAQGPEIADTRARDSRPNQPEIADHNIKTNTKLNKSFCSSNDKKINNEIKQVAKFWEPGNPDYDRVNKA